VIAFLPHFSRISSFECPNNLEVHVVKCWHK